MMLPGEPIWRLASSERDSFSTAGKFTGGASTDPNLVPRQPMLAP
jgi:hypothetical protein